MRRIDIGIASYQNPDKLESTIACIRQYSTQDWRLLVVDNASPDPRVREVITRHANEEPRIQPLFLEKNTNYPGAVNELLQWAETEYIVYCDNDAHIQTPGWDNILIGYLDRNLELGMVFGANYNSYEILRDKYTECLWGTGCFWGLKRLAMADVGLFDESLGHQEEVDYQTRLRLAGWRMGVAKEITVNHFASATSSPEAQERIGRGVVNWVNKWEKYFCGAHMNYHSPNVLRFEDWPCNALYLEEWFKSQMPHLNDTPEVVNIGGREYDLIKVPRLKDYYRGRII